MKRQDSILIIAVLLLLAAAMLSLAGCGGKGWPVKPPALPPEQSPTVAASNSAQAGERALEKHDELGVVVESMTPTNLPETKPQATTLLPLIRRDIVEAITNAISAMKLGQVEEGKWRKIVEDKDEEIGKRDKRIAELQDANPMKGWLFKASAALGVLGVVVLIAAGLLKKMGLVPVGLGCLLLAALVGGTAYKLNTIFAIGGGLVIGLFVVGAIVAGWYAWMAVKNKALIPAAAVAAATAVTEEWIEDFTDVASSVKEWLAKEADPDQAKRFLAFMAGEHSERTKGKLRALKGGTLYAAAMAQVRQ